jgi:ribokinase
VIDSPRLLSLGSINADFQMRVDRAAAGAETVAATLFTRLGGGKAANRALLARRLGVPATLIGCVGNDDFREQALAPLRAVGVDLAGVSTVDRCSTGAAFISVSADGKKQIVLAANANEAWDEDTIRNALMTIGSAPAGSILVVDYEVSAPVVRRVADAARARAIPLIVDPSWPDHAEREVLAQALAVAPNADEARTLTGVDVRDATSAGEAALRLGELGVPLAFVKLADGGCVYAERGRLTSISPLPVDVVDTTGAGDAFTGALAVALMEGRASRDAAVFATAASHVAVRDWGSQPSYRGRGEVEALVPQLSANARDVER